MRLKLREPGEKFSVSCSAGKHIFLASPDIVQSAVYFLKHVGRIRPLGLFDPARSFRRKVVTLSVRTEDLLLPSRHCGHVNWFGYVTGVSPRMDCGLCFSRAETKTSALFSDKATASIGEAVANKRKSGKAVAAKLSAKETGARDEAQELKSSNKSADKSGEDVNDRSAAAFTEDDTAAARERLQPIGASNTSMIADDTDSGKRSFIPRAGEDLPWSAVHQQS